jgi:hypothetical protein
MTVRWFEQWMGANSSALGETAQDRRKHDRGKKVLVEYEIRGIRRCRKN